MEFIINIPELDAQFAELESRLTALETAKSPVVEPPAPPVDPPETPPEVPSGPLVIPAYVAEPPVGQVITVSADMDTDIGKAINAADKKLGGNVGTIQVEGKSYLLDEQARISPGHQLRLMDGFRAQVIGKKEFYEGRVIQYSDSSIVGVGTATIVEPKDRLFDPAIPDSKFWSHVIIQSEGDTRGPASGPNSWMRHTEITTNLTIHNLTIQGSMMQPEGGAQSTVQLGNAHGVNLSHIKLIDTSSLGITAGGTGLTGNHAENWVARYCEFLGVASQAFAVVNGKGVLFELSRFLRSGKLFTNGKPYEGAACVDLEPNAPQDVCRDIQVRDIEIDSTDSPFDHGNGVILQNENGSDFGNVLVERVKVVAGSPIRPWLHSCFMVFGLVQDVTLRNNDARYALHSLYWFENGTNLRAENNTGIGRGRTGSESVEIKVHNVTNSTFKGFDLKLSESEPKTAKMRFLETGNSSGNTFEDNVPAAERR